MQSSEDIIDQMKGKCIHTSTLEQVKDVVYRLRFDFNVESAFKSYGVNTVIYCRSRGLYGSVAFAKSQGTQVISYEEFISRFFEPQINENYDVF